MKKRGPGYGSFAIFMVFVAALCVMRVFYLGVTFAQITSVLLMVGIVGGFIYLL